MADIAPGKAAAKLESFGLGKATAYDDPHQMLTEERLDLVSITTPPSSHAPQIADVLSAIRDHRAPPLTEKTDGTPSSS